MNVHASHIPSGRRLQLWALAWLISWWRLLQFAALLVSRAFLPSTYRRDNWRSLSEQVVLASAENLVWFTMLTSLISVVIIRIVVVTSISYGLSRYALEMVVRVLVLELVPLTAALFVALRTTLPAGVESPSCARPASSPRPTWRCALSSSRARWQGYLPCGCWQP
ncbi:ABC transporter permease [Pseudoduganella sp. UC29_106]|uniref:ABC transporter permease n=1 Tax=Pseudoduganella sp. UC29_106 TaxID=3374553 RepID=UPI003756C9D5